MTGIATSAGPGTSAEPRPLGFPFDRGQYRHELVERAGLTCLVRRTSTHRDSAGAEHYEVVRLLVVPETERTAAGWQPTGRIVERYPSTESWGSAAWTYPDRESAEARYAACAGKPPQEQQGPGAKVPRFPSPVAHTATPGPIAARREGGPGLAGSRAEIGGAP